MKVVIKDNSDDRLSRFAVGAVVDMRDAQAERWLKRKAVALPVTKPNKRVSKKTAAKNEDLSKGE